jgi:hypothetical protein
MLNGFDRQVVHVDPIQSAFITWLALHLFVRISQCQ